MKVCLVTKLFPPSTGGAEMYWLNLSNALGRLGHNVDVFTQSYIGISGSVDTHKNVTVYRIRKSRQLVNLDTFIFSLRARSCIEFSSYDIIHGSLRPASTIALPTDSIEIPIVLTSHGTSYDAWRTSEAKSFKDLLFKWVFHPANIIMDYYSGRHSDNVIAVSDHVQNRLSEFYNIKKGNIRQITPGLDTGIFYPRKEDSNMTNSESFTLLFVGRVEPIKGLDLIIRSLSKMDNDNIELIIAGEGSDVQRLQSLIKSLEIQNNVSFVGRVPHEKLPILYSDSDLFVLPSEYESLSFVVREAMACGLPALCADVGGISTSVTHGENGYLVERTPESFIRVIDQLLDNSKLLTELEKNAAMSAKEWSWDKNAKKTEALYKQLV
ncbi:glycosyltransferase family 1 protein [Halorubrum sp. SS5]|nr:glycosyltransferase family 1 protein [Halorubrum sp. SS5]